MRSAKGNPLEKNSNQSEKDTKQLAQAEDQVSAQDDDQPQYQIQINQKESQEEQYEEEQMSYQDDQDEQKDHLFSKLRKGYYYYEATFLNAGTQTQSPRKTKPRSKKGKEYKDKYLSISHINKNNFWRYLIIIVLALIIVFQLILKGIIRRERQSSYQHDLWQLKLYNSNQAKLYGAPYEIINTTILAKTNPNAKYNQFAPKNMNQVPMSSIKTKLDHPSKTIAGITEQQKIDANQYFSLKSLDIYQPNPIADKQRSYYQQKYRISKYKELPFCIVVPSFNNAQQKRYLNNIRSILMQEYQNYHLVFVDDASTDGTGELVQKELMASKLKKERYVVIKNKEKMSAMSNLRRAAIQFCEPEDIFLIVDGDDELIGRQVLKLFNSVFQSNGSWFVYTNFLNIKGGIGYSRPFPDKIKKQNLYRKHSFITSHLRAFYTQLFINIKEADLKDENGAYLKAANDVAICIPILEQAHTRVTYVPELTYYYNSHTGMNNHYLRLKEQRNNDKNIRRKKPYAALETLFQTMPGFPAIKCARAASILAIK